MSDQQRPASATEDDSSSGNRFDQRLGRLEEIVTSLEDGDLELEPAIDRYKEGVALLKECRGVLAGYRQQVEELTEQAEGGMQPYEGDPDVQRAEFE